MYVAETYLFELLYCRKTSLRVVDLMKCKDDRSLLCTIFTSEVYLSCKLGLIILEIYNFSYNFCITFFLLEWGWDDNC